MKDKDLKNLAQAIFDAEQEIGLGKNVQSNEDKIEQYMKNLSPGELVKLIYYIEKLFDNKEIF